MQGRHRAEDRGLPDDATKARALLDALEAIGSAPDLETTLRRTASIARDLSRAAYAAVEVNDADGPRRLEDGELPDMLGELLELELLAHGAVLGRVALRRSRGGFDDLDRELTERFAVLVGPLVANAVAYDESERRRRWLEATVKVAAALAPTMHPEEARSQLVSGIRAATGAPLVALLLDGGGHGEDRWEMAAHDAGEPGDGGAAAVREAVSQLCDDLAAAGDSGRAHRAQRVVGVESLLVPLPTQLAPAGVLLVEHPGTPVTLGGVERQLLATFAGQAALALDRAHAIEERHELLITADRDRIARDLHDLVIQRLYATGLQLQAARAGDPAGIEAAVSTTVRELDLSIRDLRATIFELGRGLTHTLSGEARALVEEYAGPLGFRPALRLTGPVDTVLAASVADEVLLVLREALSNIARHARASAAQVELTASPAWFMLRVADDGIGMPAEAGVASGLRNAGRRAEALGGVMRLGSTAPHGACLVWLVPAAR